MTVHICFHGIGSCTSEREKGEARYWMAEHVFLPLIDKLAEHPEVRLSFDDGNRSDVEIALPALRERGMSATFFALAGRLDDPASLGPRDLQDLRAAGMGIGNHGWTHMPWRGLSEVDARRELIDARAALEEASGATITQAALPLGRYDRRLLHRLKTAGYAAVYSSDRFRARPGSWLQARYSVTSSDTVQSVLGLLLSPPGYSEARNALVSQIKRLR